MKGTHPVSQIQGTHEFIHLTDTGQAAWSLCVRVTTQTASHISPATQIKQ